SIRTLIHFSPTAGGLPARGTRRDVRADAHGLPAIARTGRRLYRAVHCAANAGRSVFPPQVARDTSLDQVWAAGNSAVGAGQARRNPLPRVVSGLEAA